MGGGCLWRGGSPTSLFQSVLQFSNTAEVSISPTPAPAPVTFIQSFHRSHPHADFFCFVFADKILLFAFLSFELIVGGASEGGGAAMLQRCNVLKALLQTFNDNN